MSTARAKIPFPASAPAPAELARLCTTLAPQAKQAAIFKSVEATQGGLRCEALESAEPAFYALFVDADRLWIALQTPARYLSQSIEADLVFTGDKIEDLLLEELLDQGYHSAMPDGPALPVEHFRSEDKLYTFRSPVPMPPTGWSSPVAVQLCDIILRSYEATFRPLGDMQDDGDEE